MIQIKNVSEHKPNPDAVYTEDDNNEHEILMYDNEKDEIEYLAEDDSEEVEDSQK